MTGAAADALITRAEGCVQIFTSRRDLCDWFKHRGYRRGAEIGVWAGQFSEAICKANPSVHLTCVDPWKFYDGYADPKNDPQRIKDAFETATNRLKPYNVAIYRMTSLEAAGLIAPGSLDFVYIDGNHAAEYVRQDLDAWVPKVRTGGIVAGHDYTERKAHIQVKPVVDRYVLEHAISPWFVLTADKSPSFFWVKA